MKKFVGGVHFRWLVASVVTCILVYLLHGQLGVALVLGESMQPGLRTGDVLLVRKTAYRKSEPVRGDIVLAQREREFIVKRVIGLPGEEIGLAGGRVYVNHSQLFENYPVERGSLTIASGRLFRNKFALVGDNRALNLSQTVHAVVSKEEIAGRVIGVLRLSALVAPWRWSTAS